MYACVIDVARFQLLDVISTYYIYETELLLMMIILYSCCGLQCQLVSTFVRIRTYVPWLIGHSNAFCKSKLYNNSNNNNNDNNYTYKYIYTYIHTYYINNKKHILCTQKVNCKQILLY